MGNEGRARRIRRTALIVVGVVSALDLAVVAAAAPSLDRATLDGARPFGEQCGSCHEGAGERAPSRAVLATLGRSEILAAMTTRVMAPIS